MSDEKGIVQYTASDGSPVKLSREIVARYIVTGGQNVDDREVFGFMAKCQARKLNPLAGDAYMVAYQGKANVIVSKDYFVRTAAQHPSFDGMEAGVVVANNKTGQLTYRSGCIVGRNSETLVGGWAEVYDKRRSHPTRAEVSLSEYSTGKSLWASKPATMIRKVALVQALREAYPDAYAGIYDSTEMGEIPSAPEPPQSHETAEIRAEILEPEREPVEVGTGPEIAPESPETETVYADEIEF
jgi:phage recombination protein Bet